LGQGLPDHRHPLPRSCLNWNGRPMSAITLTQELTRLRSINPPGDERPCAELLGRLLEAAGL